LFELFHPGLHPLFETLGYVGGFAVYRHARRSKGDFLTEERRWVVIASAAVGALLGSHILGLLEQVPQDGLHWQRLLAPGGKTIVGGLLGGWIAVEIVKYMTGVKSRTGDLFVVPLCVGIAIGRTGCFLTGLADDTYGKPTLLPWGVDFGDGTRRHPTQLYEFVFLVGLGWLLSRYNARPHRNGGTFRMFMATYLGWRFLIDFLKPQPLVGGMNVIQWACIAGLLALGIGEIEGVRESDHV
jgi:phosphatidylglycerol---prolipoprotein diacylglyceryl transferase